MKKRLLMVTEASYLNTGFATYSRELLNRLFSTNKYEIAELGCYGAANDPRANNVPWLFFPNLPNNDEENQVYERSIQNQYGAYKFELACLAFKPDVVFSILDPWMNSYQIYSPFRRFYNLVHMPTVDGVPLMEEWVSDYKQTDALLSYTEWGGKQMLEATNGAVNYGGAAPGGANAAFAPVNNKEIHKEKMGIRGDSIIIGMVARNQVRKLFPDLMRDFAKLLTELDDKTAAKTFLYLHTAYPDLGWDIPRLLNEHKLGHKVLFTYKCRTCKHSSPLIYQDARTVCPNCKSPTASLSHSMDGVSTEELASIYNLFDIYVQYSNCEGLGIPVVEAAHCGLPVIVVNYSGMADFVTNIGAYSVEPKHLHMDCITGRYMAIPDGEQFIRHAKHLISLPPSMKENIGMKCRHKAIQVFDWNKALTKWVNIFDNLQPKIPWNAPPNIHEIPQQVPNNLNPEQMVRWCFSNVAGRPDLTNTFLFLSYIRDLNWGARFSTSSGICANDLAASGARTQIRDFKLEEFVNEMMAMGHNKNNWERERVRSLGVQ